MTFTDGLAVSAITLAVVAIASEILFFVVQTDRAMKSQREISDYVGQMRAVLAKIEGLTTSTREQLQEHFTLAFKAAIGQDRASVAEDLAGKLRLIEDRTSGLEESIGAQVSEDIKSQIDELREQVSSLAAELGAVAKEASSAGDIASAAGRRETGIVLTRPAEIEPGGKVMLELFGAHLSVFDAALDMGYVCQVWTPDGRRLLADFPFRPQPVLVFPDDFVHASTELPGRYEVTVSRKSLLVIGDGLVATTSFAVLSGPGED